MTFDMEQVAVKYVERTFAILYLKIKTFEENFL